MLDLVDLPDQYEVLNFLAGRDPQFLGGQQAVTREAVTKITDLYHVLEDRLPEELDVLRDFLLQCVWCMFAEDLGQLPEHRFSVIVDDLIADSRRSSADDLHRLFEWLNTAGKRPDAGMYEGVPYANGGLFERPASVGLVQKELELLREAARFDWRRVEPSIFGSLLEGALGREKQWALGAHYTHEADIQKVVQPTIVEPWTERIEALTKNSDAIRMQDELMSYIVLDPACGSGNFLYVAYRELRRIEQRLREREQELREAEGKGGQSPIAFYPLQNVCGIELDRFAVSLARVTLWMGHKLATLELGLDEGTLPLADLSGIRVGDALRTSWPRAEAIIGNPPFHGSQNLRKELGDDYVAWLGERFGIGVKDYCVYWFRLAHDHLPDGRRAGLVGTNSISQNRMRKVSLNYIAEHGGVITDAVSKQKWPGAAVVNVSIVNWVKHPPTPPAERRLDGVAVAGISTRLVESPLAVEEFEPLAPNSGRCFQGPIPAGDFYLTLADGEALRARQDAPYTEVVRPYLIGDDITDDPRQQPRRYAIDFGFRTLEQAMAYPAALDIVRRQVKPARDRNRDRGFREQWWRFGRPRGEMRDALRGLPRYIGLNRIGKRMLFVWCDATTCPSDLVIVFAFDDDYSMGVISSSAHRAWAVRESSTLRVDSRYTPTSAFATFPWPTPDEGMKQRIGELSAAIIQRRRRICVEREIGLTDLYNQIDEGAWQDLAEFHADLDGAVALAYGWPAAVASDPLRAIERLVALHAEVRAGRVEYAPFGPPGTS
ncbi:MAG: class I SAM-dependent DNA methyltransferase [Thermoleophilaceae bacterium]